MGVRFNQLDDLKIKLVQLRVLQVKVVAETVSMIRPGILFVTPLKVPIFLLLQAPLSIRCKIYHRHFSSIRLMEMLCAEGTTKSYLCPSCISRHKLYLEERVKIVVSDSTLHQFFAPPNSEDNNAYKGDTMHTGYITIPGGCIDELFNAFSLDQKLLPAAKPIDCVLVMGYNDLVKGHSKHFIMNTFEVFSKPSLCWSWVSRITLTPWLWPA